MKPAVTIRACLALGVAAITVLVVLAVAAVQFLALRSFLVGAEYERLELLLPRLEQTLTTIPASSTGPYVLNTLPRTVDVRVIREGRVVAVTPEFPAISLTLPIGRARRAGHDVLISTFNLNGTLATAQLASDVLGVVNPLRAYLGARLWLCPCPLPWQPPTLLSAGWTPLAATGTLDGGSGSHWTRR